MWGTQMLQSSMAQYQAQASNSYMQHYGATPVHNQGVSYWNGCTTSPDKPAHYMDVHSYEEYQNRHRQTSQNASTGDVASAGGLHAEDINVSAVLAERMRFQQILNSNSYNEEARQKIAECDLKIKKWNENNEARNPTNNYIRWGDSKQMADPSSRKPHKNGSHNNKKQSGGGSHKEGQGDASNGKKYLESWTDTMQQDPEMSNRQRKKQIYGMQAQTWTREDFFQRLPPAHSPFGLKMLKGMGWRHGQAIGKSKEGHIAPIPVDFRIGRQGLCTKEEKEKFNLQQGRPRPVKKTNPIKNIQGKHPVSLLAEHCMKRQIGPPKYEVVFEYGNFHSKSVLVSVTVAERTFEPSQPSPYKKHGKAVAATLALKELEWAKDD